MTTTNGAPMGVGRRPGEWPEGLTPPGRDDLIERLRAEQQRREDARDNIRADLEAQPTTNCVRTAARRWVKWVNELADEVVEQRKQAMEAMR